MTRKILLGRALLAALLAAVAAGTLAPAASAGLVKPTVPSALEVPAGNKLFLVGRATGVQIYSCTATTSGHRWLFVAPRADVYAGNGKLVTTHFGGPTWVARDGSSVVGRLVARSDVDAATIPWLLLEAASTSSGADGDRLAGTSYIQRIATAGGVAPAPGECDEETPGTTAEVPYTADYYFWKAVGD